MLAVQVEPCCWMTYTTHRDTQETLQILDRLDLGIPTQADPPAGSTVPGRSLLSTIDPRLTWISGAAVARMSGSPRSG